MADASESWESERIDSEYLAAGFGDGGYADAEVLALPGGGYRMYVGYMGDHSIVSFFSDDGLDWSPEAGVRIASGAFPDAVLLPDGRVRLYYQGPGVIQSAISNDGGLTFSPEAGTRIGRGWHGDLDPDNVGAPTTVRLPDGR